MFDRRTKTGFTLVEILLVLAAIGLMVAIVVPSLSAYLDRSRLVESTIQIGEMSKKIYQYEKSKGTLPSDLDDLGLENVLDPWGRPYEYYNVRTTTGKGKPRKDKKLKPINSDFDLYSLGRDGLSKPSLNDKDSRDDVVRAREGAFIGLAEEFDP
jgi:general secretion pathway protein G